MDKYLIWIVAVIGAGTLCSVFCRMKEGFGPYNLRAFGITQVATFATLLALRSDQTSRQRWESLAR